MSDLTHIYWFGPGADRKSPLFVWGHKNSGVEAPGGGRYDDGVKSFCSHLRPVADDHNTDGYAMIPMELDWTKYGKKTDDNIAYNNTKTGVKITYFPVIHTCKGSIGYKLEWTSPSGKVLSMIYTGDTKTEYHGLAQAANSGKGVDVFIHEMSLPAL